MSKFPTPKYATFELTLPSDGKKYKFRQFTVFEEKKLLIAKESDDVAVIAMNMKDVLNECFLGALDFDALPYFDVEYCMNQLRGKSVGEVIEASFICTTCRNDDSVVNIPIDITKVTVDGIKTKKERTVELSAGIGVVLKYPTLALWNDIINIVENPNDINSIAVLMAHCIDTVFDEESVYPTKDVDIEETAKFIKSLVVDDYRKIESFVKSLPKSKLNVKYACKCCGAENDHDVESFASFFG